MKKGAVYKLDETVQYHKKDRIILLVPLFGNNRKKGIDKIPIFLVFLVARVLPESNISYGSGLEREEKIFILR